ncbi:MAG: aldehyde dehydrogenase family protein, partial [Acidimicrobiales bacterium]
MTDHTKLYIDGAWVPSDGTDTIDVINPSTEQVITAVPAGTPTDVDRAVAAARAAFETWGFTSKEERGKYLQAIAEGLAARSDEIAQVISDELGMPLMWASMIQAGLPIGNISGYQQILDEFPFEETVGNSLVVREPIGVVGCITPWNYPLHQIIAKVAPALAAGCTVVVKPREVTPLDAFILAEVIDSAGLPAGVFNLVTGTGPV